MPLMAHSCYELAIARGQGEREGEGEREYTCEVCVYSIAS